MALTRRARRRLALLAISLVVLAGLGVGVWFLQQSIKDARAVEARAEGLAAAKLGDWDATLSSLSLALSRDQEDLEAMLVLAEARSRVPEPNNRHLTTAMNYYTRATDLAERPGVDSELRRRALGGRARMELANRAIVRLEETAQEMLGLDPSDREALDYLFEIKKLRGEYLPESTELVVRGDRTDAAWLEAMRETQSNAALRWALERVVLAPADIDRREQLLAVLREGGSEDLQLLRDGVLRESPQNLAEQWADERDSEDVMPLLLMASEHLRRSEIDEARAVITEAEAIGIDDPSLLLRAVSIREALQTPDDLAIAESLLKRAEQEAMAAPTVAMNIAIRHWNSGRSDDAFRVLDNVAVAVAELDSAQKLDLAANAALLSVLDGRSDVGTRTETLIAKLDGASLDPEARELIRQVAEMVRTAQVEKPTEEDLIIAQTAAAALPTNPLVQTVFGDVLARIGLQTAANEAWTRAGEMVGQRSLPIGRRVVRGALDDQSVTEAFRQAVRYAGGTRTLASVIALCEAWLALDASGIEAREVEPRFTDFESPVELLQEVLADVDSSGGDAGGLLPLLAEASIREGDLITARETLERALAADIPTASLVRMAAIGGLQDLGLDDELVAKIRSQAETDEEQDQVAILEAARLRQAGRPDEALETARERFGDRSDDAGRRTLGLELLDHAIATDGPIDEAMAILIEVPTNERILRRLQLAAIRGGDVDASIAVVDRARVQHGAESGATILAEAEHVLAFEADNADSVRQAVLRADPTVAAGRGGPDLAIALVRLLQAMEPPQTSRAIEVLSQSVRARPARFDTAVLFIDLLQQAGRLGEAAEQVQALYRRRNAAPPEIRRLIPKLVAGQGDESLVAESACELAERTGRPLDRLECARALYLAGDSALADPILDELLADPDRPFAVDIDAAARLVRWGDPEGGIALLQASTVFPSVLQRDLALAGLLLQLKRWDDLAEVLTGLGPEGDSSAEGQLIRAILLLQGPDRSVAKARSALTASTELAPDDAGILRRNVTIRLADPELRDSVPAAIDLLGGLRPAEAELMRLAFDASPDGDRFTPTDEHVVRAQALVKSQPTIRPAWTLALEILSAAYEEALADADPEATARRGEQLVELAESAVGRFPADSALPAQLSQIHLALGNEDDALAAAREGLRRAGAGRRLGNAIPVAAVELRMGRPEAAIRTLEPFREEIETGADERPRAWQLLYASLLRTGRVDEAWEVFRARSSAREEGGLIPWLVNAEVAPPAAARAAVERALATLPLGASRLPAVGTLAVVYRRTGDAAVRTAIESALAEIEATNPDPAMAMQLRFTRLSLDEGIDPIGTIEGYAALVDELPAGTIDRLKRFQSLSPQERARTAPIANAAIMAMNNFAAVTATAVLEGRVPSEQVQSLLDRAARTSADLGIIMSENPEVLDTRALVALARGEGDRAIDLATAAIRLAPQRPVFRATLAKGLALSGRDQEAVAQAREAIRMHRREAEVDEDAVAELQRLLEQVQD